MAEAGVYLMPIYAAASWIGFVILGESEKCVLIPVALVGWVWAGIDTIRSESPDLGIVAFFLVLISALWKKRSGSDRKTRSALILSCILVALNYALVLVGPLLYEANYLAKAKAKGQLWTNVFVGYGICMIYFWVFAAVKTWMVGEYDGVGYDVYVEKTH